MALADTPACTAGGPGPYVLERRPAVAGLGTPLPALILLGIVSVQVGAGLAKNLFSQISPDAVVMLRLLTSAVVLLLMCRSALRDLRRTHSVRDVGVAVLFGLVLAGMNFSLIQAIARIPLGVAVTVEFLGPLAWRSWARGGGSTWCGRCSPSAAWRCSRAPAAVT